MCPNLGGTRAFLVEVRMKTQAYVDEATNRTGLTLYVACAECRHSEFIHSDRDVRRCLYAECPCAAFRRPTPAELAQPTPREAEGRKRRGPRTDWAGSSAAS
jgi:hypothetical protein